MFRFLDAAANEFICNEWERKGIYMAFYFCIQCNMGPGANVLRSAVRISS